jgi:hypothetical protein
VIRRDDDEAAVVNAERPRPIEKRGHELDGAPGLLGVAVSRHRREAETAVAVDNDGAVWHADVQKLVNRPIAPDAHGADELFEKRRELLASCRRTCAGDSVLSIAVGQ